MRPVSCWMLLAWLLMPANSIFGQPQAAEEEKLLASAHTGTSGPALVEFLRKRSTAKVERDPLLKLVKLLASEKPAEVERAMGDLIAFGSSALPVLREAQKDATLARAKPQIEECLKWIDGPPAGDLTRAVLRRAGRLKPAGLAGVLLSVLQTIEDDVAADDARRLLTTLAIHEGRVNPVLEEAALKNPNAVRRAAAIEIVCQADAVAVIRKLFRDSSRDIRFRTASLRAELGDGEAVPVLIDLLGDPASPEARSALDALQRLAGPRGSEPALSGADVKLRRDVWASWWRELNNDTLLKYFRDRTPNIDPDKIGELIAQLGSKSFRVRQKAEQDLINLRGLSVPLLEKALKDPDIEIIKRAERCLREILAAPDAGKSSAYVRLLVLRKPPEAARVLLGFVAFADAESVVDEVRQGLRQLARHDANVLDVLRAGLADKAPQRRGIAAEVLAEFANVEQLAALRKLLGDPEALVRQRSGMGLALRQDKQAIPVLIDLLAVLPSEQGWTIEDVLRRLAGEKAPAVALDADEAARKKCRDAWAEWWKVNGDRTDLGLLRGRPVDLGLTLLSLWESGANQNYIVEMGRDKKHRWRINDLGYAFDFVVLPGNRLLLAEHTKNRVTERTFKGDIIWQYEINSPINCQRLPNGHTFITAGDRCVIVDRQKNEVLKVDRQGGLMGGQRFRDGRIVLLNGSGQCFVLDARGAMIRQFQIMGGMSNYGGIQELANGRVLIAQHDRAKVSEYDLEGKLVWSADTPSPNFATRIANGNTLVGSQDNRSLVELDRDGKLVSRYEPGTSVWRVRRR
jgi:HEAT repeat protein